MITIRLVRRSSLLWFCCCFVAIGCQVALCAGQETSTGNNAQPSPPNVLFIAVDDLRVELGCYGDAHILSPNIDALARSGILFQRAYCQQALCGPSRASVLTGLRPDSARVHGNHVHFREHYPDIVTLPEHFKNNGYHTRAMGKIFHGVFPEGSSITVADTFGDRQSWSIPAFRPGPRYYYTEEGIAAARQVYQEIYQPENPGPDDWTEKLVFGPATEAPSIRDEVLYDGQVADQAIASLQALADDDEQPFFLAVGFIKPHSPHIAPKRYWDLYDAEAMEMPSSPSLPDSAPRIALHHSGELRRYTDQPGTGPIPLENQRRVRHAYFACISYIDAQIGRVLDELDRSGLSENTIVVLWSDHGYHLGEQSLWGKTTNFELDTRVPLIVRVPDAIGNGSVCNAMVELVDLYPTLIELCGLPERSALEGLSFAPLIDDPARPWKAAAFSQFTRGETRGYSIRTTNYRYTEWLNTNSWSVIARELYEYQDAMYPIEPPNQVRDHPDLAQRMSQSLALGRGWKTIQRDVGSTDTDRISVDQIFGDHMVLPRNVPVPIWGAAQPDTRIQVSFRDQERVAIADPHGRWSVLLSPMDACAEPSQLRVDDLVFDDILIGDVWMCSGQSNMRWRVDQSDGAANEIANALQFPRIRFLDLSAELYPVHRVYPRELLRSTTPDNYFQWSGWLAPSQESLPGFSAVAWFFAKRMQQLEPDVPIGLIHNSIGGSPMEAWIPESALLANESLRPIATIDWTMTDHPVYPDWCGLRGRQNLADYFDAPDGPVPAHPFAPGFLFDAGVRPVVRFPFRGVIWYQGESNATRGTDHQLEVDPAWNRLLFETLMNAWRTAWNDESLPFYYVQLPGLDRNWPAFREMQSQVADADSNATMIVAIDAGDPHDVHPTDKEPIGDRLADAALGIASSPRAVSITPEKIEFDQSIQTTDGQAIRGFELAGANRVFLPAEARIEGNAVILSSSQVDQPTAVRYGWANDPDVNLVGTIGGHYVSPFRSDDWESIAESESGNRANRSAVEVLTGFEELDAGPISTFEIGGIVWTAPEGHAEIADHDLARTGRRCLHLMGGESSQILLELSDEVVAKDFGTLTFAAERWTRREPFSFTVECSSGDDQWVEVYRGDDRVVVGRAYKNDLAIAIPVGTRSIRFTCQAPVGTGILVDDMAWVESAPLDVTRVKQDSPRVPLLIGLDRNPLSNVVVHVEGNRGSKQVTALEFEFVQGLDQVESIALNGETYPPQRSVRIEVSTDLRTGVNEFVLEGRLLADADFDSRVLVRCIGIEIDGERLEPDLPSNLAPQRIGVALRRRGQDGVHTYRIPGLTSTNEGTLIAVFDNRYRSSHDLPGDIDVGMCRSTDGGRTWSPMTVIMDMGSDPDHAYDGVGDPSVLTDRSTGTIWVAATWSHGNRSWNGSGPGLTPDETGQFMLVKSEDDGLTWSEPINITEQVKADPDWRFVLAGPGRGITLRDGTIAFPAQYRGVDDDPINGKPFSTIVYSQDHGESWHIGNGVKIDTTEAQIVQLGDDSIMINCRDNRGGSRSVYTTNDLGRTWQLHPTSRNALPEPVCNAGLLRVEPVNREATDASALLLFSNPNTTSGRRHMTLKVSDDEGMSWPATWHTMYDERLCNGYSCISPVGEEHIGVLYEGAGELYYLRFSIAELLRPND